MEQQQIRIYRDFCKDATLLPLFQQPWWLDAVCGPGNWKIAIALNEDTGVVEGVLPYYIRSRFRVSMLAPPPLTPFFGPTLFPPSGLNSYKLRAFEEETIHKLLHQLPNLPIVRFKLHFDYCNWLPFREAGFRQTTMYSYRIKELDDPEKIWNGFHPKLRNKISHSARFCRVQQVADARSVFSLFEQRFRHKGQRPPISEEWFAGVDQALTQHQARAAFLCSDLAGRPLAGAYITWDEYSSYLMITGFDSQKKIRGATALAIWESIQFIAARGGLIYDFEGSMLPGVERFFREFGGSLYPYHRLTLYRNKLWQAIDLLR